MSTTGNKAVVDTATGAEGARKAARLRHTPGGATLGSDAGREAQRLAAAVLEVLAGVRTPGQAAEALGISQARYFQIETRAMQALVAGCVPVPRGRGTSALKELTALQRHCERLQRQLSRQQTLLRLAQRHLGLTPAKTPANAVSGKGKKRPRRPVVRALRAAEALHERCSETSKQQAAATERKQAEG
jgi:hypothetical protein